MTAADRLRLVAARCAWMAHAVVPVAPALVAALLWGWAYA